jgi:hypothetical protein
MSVDFDPSSSWSTSSPHGHGIAAEGPREWMKAAPTITMSIRTQHKAHADVATGLLPPFGFCAIKPSTKKFPPPLTCPDDGCQ